MRRVGGEWRRLRGKEIVPVRPNTLVTFTSLTGTLPESIFTTMVSSSESSLNEGCGVGGRSCVSDYRGCCRWWYFGVAICAVESLWDAECDAKALGGIKCRSGGKVL